LQKDPLTSELDIKHLIGSKNHYRLRIWKYRFIYELRKKELVIYFYKADSRGGIYK
jgi:mRNA interferase RelE/StbE